MRKTIIFLVFVFFQSCNPFFVFKPRAINSPLIDNARLNEHQANVVIDSFGIPFIRARTLTAALYSLGFMHARDRLFQLDLMRHAATGRVAELFGEKALDTDRKLRTLTYKLDEQFSRLSKEEYQLLDAYVRGVNEGALQRGRSAEHFLLGINFEPLRMVEVLAIARLQAWQLASDLDLELARLKIAQSAMPTQEKMTLLAATDDQNSAILKGRSVLKNGNFSLPSYLGNFLAPFTNTVKKVENFIQNSQGASNAWVVEDRIMQNNAAVLMNDPHLRHTWPSNFYLATIQTDDFSVSGASFVGLPAILIGASNTIAWGVTASYLNTQDSVFIKRDSTNPLVYEVDNKKYVFKKWMQKFCLDKKENCHDEEHYVSIFGPVWDSRHDRLIGENELFAVMWTGFYEAHQEKLIIPFWKLVKAKNILEAHKYIQSMTLPGVNIVLADIEGKVGYSYAGLVPKRDKSQHPSLPLDGRHSSSLWTKFLEKPHKLNPDSGIIITANQNIFSHNDGEQKFYGQEGAPPYRALRISEVINKNLKSFSKLSVEDLAHIQRDSTSIEARTMSPLLGGICREKFHNASGIRKKFAQLLEDFDGNFTIDSLAALPYKIMIEQLLEAKLNLAFEKDLLKRVIHIGQLSYNLKHDLAKKILDYRHSSSGTAEKEAYEFVASQCEPAFQKLIEKAGKSPWKWRWGRHHYLQRKSPFARAALIGKFFTDKKRPVAGFATSPMAESGIPVERGANLRFQAVMTRPPQLKIVLDSGNSGLFGKHSLDQAQLWHRGKTMDLIKNWDGAKKQTVMSFGLDSRTSK
ncbi:MAG: penicillin acylase family protein [Myxococcales bacterium]|nr:penicillin acylase family protein [Myxococcales bacterium]USN50132.1 MAG: penicillin acylase family protein [Myxococcales bacterium]